MEEYTPVISRKSGGEARALDHHVKVYFQISKDCAKPRNYACVML